ncbi:MAG: 2-phospho-L-lactate transferase CofD family protein, partial [Sarcina sp.]
GETSGFKASDHVKELIKYCGEGIVDTVIANIGTVDEVLEARYNEKNSQVVELDRNTLEELNINIVEGNLVEIKHNHLIRHNATALSELIIKTIMERQE